MEKTLLCPSTLKFRGGDDKETRVHIRGEKKDTRSLSTYMVRGDEGLDPPNPTSRSPLSTLSTP